MDWQDLLGHNKQREWFQTAISRGRLATSFLFVGPAGIGKKTFAQLLAKSLLCRHTPCSELNHCGGCEDCAMVAAGTHPDLIQVEKPADKAFIPLELLIGEREKRMRAGLCHDISLRPYGGRRKIAILDDADTLNIEGANCLLKALEEPPVDSLLILIGTSLPRQLPTIRSRCQAILFRPLETEQLAELLLREDIVDSRAAANELAPQSKGSLAEARLILDPELRDFRTSLLQMLSMQQIPIRDLAKQCGSIVDAAGKDGRAKRERMKFLFRAAADFYRALTMRLFQGDSTDVEPRITPRDAGLIQQSAAEAAGHWHREVSDAIRCWQCCLQAVEHVDRNANQAGLLEAWSTDLAHASGC